MRRRAAATVTRRAWGWRSASSRRHRPWTGQRPAKSCHVARPRSSAPESSSSPSLNLSPATAAGPWRKAQPPRADPPRPSGSCMTPSRERNSMTMTRLMSGLLWLLSSQRRTGRRRGDNRALRRARRPARSTAASRAVRASSPVIPDPRSRSIAVERTWPMMTLIDSPGSSCSSLVAFTAASSASRAGGGVALGMLELVAELEHGVAEQRHRVGQLGRRRAVAADRAERPAGQHARVAHRVVHLLGGLGVERHALARAPARVAQGERLARQGDRVEEGRRGRRRCGGRSPARAARAARRRRAAPRPGPSGRPTGR